MESDLRHKTTMKVCALILLLATSVAHAFTYDCKVTKKLGEKNVVSDAELKKWQFSVKIHDLPKPRLERCSLETSKNRVTCDSYDVDRVVVDENINAKKFYHFASQFDIQLFRDLSFVENNGRGGIAFGKCESK